MFDICINSVLFGSSYRFGCHLSGKYTVLRIVLEVTAGKCTAVDIHGWRIPAGHLHFIRHLTNLLSKSLCNIMIPGAGNHNSRRKTDGPGSGKVVIDGSRAVTVNGTNFIYTFCLRGLITSDCSQRIHITYGQLVKQLLPLGIIKGQPPHISKLYPVLCSCHRHGITVIVVGCRIVITVVYKGFFVFLRHAHIFWRCRCFFIVGKSICAGKISQISVCIFKLIYCNCFI